MPAESFFDPPGALDIGKGLGSTIFETVMKCPLDYREELFHQITAAGGNASLINFAERTQNDVIKMYKAHRMKHACKGFKRVKRVRVFTPPVPQLLAFKGASLMSSTHENNPQFFISADEYKMKGPDIFQIPTRLE